MIILLALVVGVQSSEQGAMGGNRNREPQDVAVSQLSHSLLKRGAKESSLDDVAVDNTMLGKPSNHAIFPTSIKAPVLQARAIARSAFKPQFQGKGIPRQITFNKDMATELRDYVYPQSCARVSTVAKSSTDGNSEYDNMVTENRMITVEESQIRYAGALAIFLSLVKSYVDMQAAGVYDYNAIAAGTAGAYLLFESARQSFCGCVLGLKWNAGKPFSFVDPPPGLKYKEFLKQKRAEALDLGAPGVAVGAFAATLAAAINGELSLLAPTLEGCAAFAAFAAANSAVLKKVLPQ